jgi:RHS repeat-associated protein
LQFDATSTPGTPVSLTANNLSHRYVWGPAVDQVLADERVTVQNGTLATDEVLYPLTDAQGTVRDVALLSGTTTSVADHITYSGFGAVVSQTNASQGCLFGNAGRPTDPATGLENDRARIYDAALMRFISEDPTGLTAGDTNLYCYCGNSPTNATDPSGLGGPVAPGGNSTPIPPIDWSANTPEAIRAEQQKVAAMTTRDQQLYQQAWQALQSASTVSESLAANAEMQTIYKRLQLDQEISQYLQQKYNGALSGQFSSLVPSAPGPLEWRQLPQLTPWDLKTPPVVGSSGTLVYHLPGEIYFSGLSMAFIGANTVGIEGIDQRVRRKVSANSQKNVVEGVDSWDTVVARLNGAAPHSLDSIIFTGHGWGLGICVTEDRPRRGLYFGRKEEVPPQGMGAQNTYDCVTSEVLTLLRKKLAPDGVLYFCTCCAASSELQTMQWLANQIQHPVVANEGNTLNEFNGTGDWIIAYPTGWEPDVARPYPLDD